jgi:phenylacetate-CoA ligase
MTARVRDWILDRRVVFDASAIDDRRMRAFHKRLQAHRPRFLLAYANTLALFAQFLQNEGLRPHRPRAIICSGEVLTDDSRAVIESTFGCRVFNRYGSREFSVIASECSQHDGMHVNAENLWVEVVTGATPSLDIEGEIIVTDLKNLAMPLIRYRTRDVGILKPSLCACGRGLPLMELKGGRVTDFLLAVTGEKVSGIVLATYAITNVPGIRQVQFVQSRRDCVTARVVRGSAWSDESARTLLARIRTFLGAAMTIQLAFVDEIPFEASGKYRFSISTVAAN